MTKNIDVYLVRHGEAEMPWSQAKDAGLSESGRRQAETVADELAPLKSLQLISSPLLRAQQTAMPLGRRWDMPTQIDQRYREVPLTSNTEKRKAWLVEVMSWRWPEVNSSISAWRNTAWDALLALEHSSVIFTHFMLINAMVARATEDERLVCFEPDYTSVTHLRIAATGECELVSMGSTLTRF
jgi:probable phosphoglycerate mutase